jgi:TonB-dependent SusC/RagA subfamily outer membrane receptor
MPTDRVRLLYFLAGLATAVPMTAAPTSLVAQAATGGVRGRVTDATSGAGIPGVQVVVVGAERVGSVTREDGSYTIASVPTGSRTIVARRIGYSAGRRTVQVAAGETATADFVLGAAALNLEQVVVTGTAAPTSRRALGTSVASVDSSALENTQAVSLDAALQGKVAGAQITQNSGNPGGGGISVRLRGTSSFISGSEPLYIVDGVIVDNSSAELRSLGSRGNVQNRLADINPADVERVEIIRGAAAAALYGSRANNGVVQIFTKRGRPGRSRVTLNTRVSSNELPKHLGFNAFPYDAAGNAIPRYNYENEIFRRSTTLENNLSVEGGNEQTTYYVNGTWTEDQGILKATDASRKGARINLTQQILPTLKLDAGANFVNSTADFLPNGEGNGVLTAVVFQGTNVNLFPTDGIYPFTTLGPNPLLLIDRFKYPQETNRFIGNARARWNPREWLAVDYNLGYDGYQQNGSEFYPRGAFPSGTAATGFSANTIRDSRIVNQDAVATLTYLFGGLNLGTSFGVNSTQQRIGVTTAAASDLIPISELVSGGATPSAAQSEVELRTLGVYGQQTLAWRDRLYLTGALRADASSTFGPDERWQLFPKVSGSYVVSDEEWFRGFVPERALSSLRLRAALGFAGNQPSILNAYSRYDDYASVSFDAKPGLVNSVTLGNAALKPERQREVEYGADLGFLNNRLSAEATYYDKLVSGLLFFRPVARSTGYTRQFADIGSMSNKGFELLVRSVNVDRPRLRWESTVTYTRNRNKVESLNIPDFQSSSGYPNRIAVGQPVGVFYGSYAARNCQTGAFLLDSLGRLRPASSLPTLSTPAGVAAREALSSGSCNNADSKYLGDPNPDFLASLLNEFTVAKNLRVRVLLDGTFGNDVMNLTRRIQDIFVNGTESEYELLPFGDPRRLSTGYLNRRGSIFEQYVENGSFVKLREVALSYNFNQAAVRRVLPGGLDVTLAGRNLYTWTDYTGYDPESNLFGQTTERTGQTAADRGFDFANYPIPRVWTISARITY